MKPIRIAHISDTHLGYRALFRADLETGRNQRAVDIEDAYDLAITDLLTRGVDLVIHAGDVFHHTRPSWAAIRAFVRSTRRLAEAGIPAIVIGGNHDTPRLRTSGSVYSVLDLALPGVTFVTNYDQETLALSGLDLAVTAIPHGKLADTIGPSAIPTPGVRNILVTHGLVSGLQLSKKHHEPGEADVSDVLLAEDFDYIALGHFHRFAKVRHNAWYSGSTERIGWGDEEADPGYAIIDLGDPGEPVEVTAIPIEGRPMKTLLPLDGESKSSRELADITLGRLERDVPPNAMARVELRNTPRPIRRETESILRRESGEFVWSLQIFSPADVLSGFARNEGAAAPANVRTLFAEFVDQSVFDEAFATLFRARGEEALAEAARQIENAAVNEDTAA